MFKEIAQVEINDKGASDMRRGVGRDIALPDKPMRGIMQRRGIKDLPLDHLLHRLETRLGAADRASPSIPLRHNPLDVI